MAGVGVAVVEVLWRGGANEAVDSGLSPIHFTSVYGYHSDFLT
eukprot:SAG22_NODE_13494_length_404_cov_1.665574_1_plen_42_part_01